MGRGDGVIRPSRLIDRLADRRARSLRQMYVGGKGNTTARRYARFWSWMFSKGIAPGRNWITLEVPGRTTGRPTRFPLGVTVVDGRRYLGAMLGKDCNWVRNVRAAQGNAIIDRRGRRPVHLAEVPVERRARLLKEFLQQVPGARPHLPVSHDRPVAEFEAIAADYPMFLIEETADPGSGQ
ncbi:nitroreductase/quinone reductase family protein [Gordonia sp. NPDC003424]